VIQVCLSSVYVEETDERSAVVEEASKLRVSEDCEVEIDTLFGEKKVMKGYVIVEVNFLKNYVVLREEASRP
jgi:hypothetical protein